MITLKFSEFMSGKYDDHGEHHELYILRNELEILYIGISRTGVWYRWFGGTRSHIFHNYEGHHYGNSPAGRYVMENIPLSMDWPIDLYTLQDCIELLRSEITQIGYRVDRLDITALEPMLIRKLQPGLNSTFVNYETHSHLSAARNAEIREAHRRSFEDKSR